MCLFVHVPLCTTFCLEHTGSRRPQISWDLRLWAAVGMLGIKPAYLEEQQWT